MNVHLSESELLEAVTFWLKEKHGLSAKGELKHRFDGRYVDIRQVSPLGEVALTVGPLEGLPGATYRDPGLEGGLVGFI